MFPTEPTALQRPAGLSFSNGSDAPEIEPGQDDLTTVANQQSAAADPFDALLSQHDARIPSTSKQDLPWGWIFLGAGVLLIVLWAIL